MTLMGPFQLMEISCFYNFLTCILDSSKTCVHMVQPGGLVCQRTLLVQVSLLLVIPYCLLVFSGLVMANCSLGGSVLIRSQINVICCFPPMLDYVICYLSQAELFCNLFPYFGYLHGYILPPSCDSRGRDGLTAYSDLAAIVFPKHRPSAPFTLHSPQCLPVLLLSAVFQVTFLTLALLLLCCFHIYIAVHSHRS